MSRQDIRARIESDVYLKIKASGINISQTINNLLKAYFQDSEIEEDEYKLIQEEKELTEKINEMQERKNLIVINLVRLREQKAEDQKKMLEDSGAMIEGLLRGGILHDI